MQNPYGYFVLQNPIYNRIATVDAKSDIPTFEYPNHKIQGKVNDLTREITSYSDFSPCDLNKVSILKDFQYLQKVYLKPNKRPDFAP